MGLGRWVLGVGLWGAGSRLGAPDDLSPTTHHLPASCTLHSAFATQPFPFLRTLRGVTEKPDTAVADRVLAERVWRDGDEGAFRTLYRRHTPALHQFALRLLAGNEHEAEDVVQDTWIRAVEHLGGFRWESSLRTWLMGIALNVCRARFRRADAKWLQAGEVIPIPVQPPDTHERLDLEMALTKLPNGYRTVLVLHDIEGLTHAEIGERLDVSANTSKSQLFHARRTLRALLTSASGEEVKRSDY